MTLRVLALCLVLTAPLRAVESVKWSEHLPRDAHWLAGEQAKAIAENLLLYQFPSGGWPKNIDMAAPLSLAQKAELEERAHDDATIDNGATTTQIEYLARIYSAVKDARYRAAAERGLDYLLAAQYSNGGWPQYFPLRKGYYTHITFNDDAMTRVLEVLRETAAGRAPFSWVDAARQEKSRAAVALGIACILKCQVIQDGKLTAWCAQHDEVTFAPAWARKFEPPSLSANESVGVVRFLMSVEKPSPAIIAAVEGAVTWLQKVKLHGIRELYPVDKSLPHGHDRVTKEDPSAPPLWARFYELGTDRPIYLGRDSIVHYHLAEIEPERRGGYAWHGTWPEKLLTQQYPAWRARLQH